MVSMKITDECDVKLCCLVEVYVLLVDSAEVAILAFLKPNSRNLDFFFNLVGVTKFICLFGFFPALFYAKIICTKLHFILIVNHFPLRKMFFGQLHLAIISATKSLAKKVPAANW